MTEEFASLIRHGREERHLEYKQSMNRADSATKTKIVKSSMAMANLCDGGLIVFGMARQPDDAYVAEGMSEADFHSFKQDDVSAEVNKYADPFVELSVIKDELDGKRFVQIQVREFAESPVVCKKDGSDFRVGVIYVRSRRTIETTELRAQQDMRELLEAAGRETPSQTPVHGGRLRCARPVAT